MWMIEAGWLAMITFDPNYHLKGAKNAWFDKSVLSPASAGFILREPQDER
jgi:hypothetical protein